MKAQDSTDRMQVSGPDIAQSADYSLSPCERVGVRDKQEDVRRGGYASAYISNYFNFRNYVIEYKIFNRRL
jgi:hypothetical protein